ncbi:hypothetical protein RU58_00022 [Achromobacter phage phiAxp-1]|uniref:hypothetical protein n=1 Tax=Achromobacter phage phiAxp-1 TaxID=1610509 RepID=UPI000655795C|nr:hypothetical protein RU58_00022 [Achromobacter phage phiAxp-1]AKJ71411.1 hypothetical protein RU58_00022 [Achromobacter phage phiAxp-1]
MKMDFETVWKNTLEKCVNEYETLRQLHREMSFSGMINGYMILNPHKADFDRYVEIVGMYEETNKVEFRAWPFEKIGKALIFGTREAADAVKAILTLQYTGREFVVFAYRSVIESRMKQLAEVAEKMHAAGAE